MVCVYRTASVCATNDKEIPLPGRLSNPIQFNPIQSKYFKYFIYLFIYDDECQQFYHFFPTLCVFFFRIELSHLIRECIECWVSISLEFSACASFLLCAKVFFLSQGWATEMPSILISCSYQSSLCTHLNYSNQTAMSETLKCTHGKYNPMGK